jgi:arginyl-tRNA synthetase
LFHILEQQILENITQHIQVRYGVDVPVALEQPKQSSFGELAAPVAFQLAKQLKRAPKQIAAELVADLEGMRVWLRSRLRKWISEHPPQRGAYAYGILTVRMPLRACFREDHCRAYEHQSEQSAHIGHLRNAVLGDTFVACCGPPVTRWKYRTTSTTPACKWPT